MYKTYMNDEKLRKLVITLLGDRVGEAFREEAVSHIIEQAEVGNLDTIILNNLIETWNQKNRRLFGRRK